MHLRRFDEWGPDAPFAWDSGNLCVEHGQEIALSIASANPLSADADGLEVVTWFFDHDYSSHPPDNQLVEVDMWVEEWDGATWSVAEQDLGTSDNKRRVWIDTQANHAYRLHNKGTRVPRNAPGCDSDHIRVFGRTPSKSDRAI